MIERLFCLTILFISAHSVPAAESNELPPIPYEDWGACPFECCTYGEWVSTSSITVYKERSTQSLVAFKIKSNEKVMAITGVVITDKYGETNIVKSISASPKNQSVEISPKVGEKVYTLHYAGEGYDLFWYKGNIYTGETATLYEYFRDPTMNRVKVISRPSYKWWAQIKNKSGKVGWTSRTDRFKNQDACG